MVSIESRMGDMAQTYTPARGYHTGEIRASWQPQGTAVQRASSVSAPPKKLSCKTCSGQRCIGCCRF